MKPMTRVEAIEIFSEGEREECGSGWDKLIATQRARFLEEVRAVPEKVLSDAIDATLPGRSTSGAWRLEALAVRAAIYLHLIAPVAANPPWSCRGGCGKRSWSASDSDGWTCDGCKKREVEQETAALLKEYRHLLLMQHGAASQLEPDLKTASQLARIAMVLQGTK